MTTVVISDNLDNEERYETDDVVEFLYTHFKGNWPETATIYDGKISKDSVVAIECYQDILDLNKLDKTVYVVIYPQGLFAIGALLVAGFAGIFLLKAAKAKKKSETAQFQAPKAGSPNNGLSNRTNNERLNERIPDIFGKVRSIPDLLSPPYFIYQNSQEVEFSWMCIGRGEYEVTDIRDDESAIESIAGTSIEVYPPNQTPNGGTPQLTVGNAITEPLVSAKTSNSVNGQKLFAPNTAALYSDARFKFFPNGTIEVDNTKNTPDPFDPDWTAPPDISFSDYFQVGDDMRIYGSYNVDGTYQLVSVDSDRIALANPAAVNAYWNNFSSGGTYQQGGMYLITDGDRRVGPFVLEDVDDVYCNVIAESGLYRVDTVDEVQSQNAVNVQVQIVVQQVDASDTPFGAIHTKTGTLIGSSGSRSRVATTIKAGIPFSGRVQVYVKRITTTDLTHEGELSDTIQWEGLLGVRNIDGTDFGDVTTVRAVTYATPGALAAKARKLNMQVIRKIPNRNTDGTWTANLPTTNFADILSFVCRDEKIGNRIDAEIDFENIYATRNEIISYFGTSLAAEFNHTFDDDNLSFEEIAATIGEAVFCSVYRQGNMIRCKFEKETSQSAILFNHRNKLPNSETRTVNFGNLEDKDGVELSYIDYTDGARLTYHIPADQSAVNPEKIRQAGVNNKLIAYLHAHRIWNRIQYQKESVDFEATQEALLLGRSDKILVADNTRTETYDGEVLAQDGQTLTLSQELKFETEDATENFTEASASFQYGSSTFSGWSSEIGVQAVFNAVRFRVKSHSGAQPSNIKVTIRAGSYTGTILAEKTVSWFDIDDDDYLTVYFFNDIDSASSLFFQWQANGLATFYGRGGGAAGSTRYTTVGQQDHSWADSTPEVEQWVELFDASKVYTIFLQSPDSTVEAIGVSPTDQLNQVLLASATNLPLTVGSEMYAPATYEIVKNSSPRVKEFLIEERNPKSGYVSSITAINYDQRYYQNDKDLIAGVVDTDGNLV